MQKYKLKRKLIEIPCDNCGQLFLKPISEYNRNTKLGRRNFCSRYCVGKASNVHLLRYKGTYDISQHCRNRLDIYSPFKYYLKEVRGRFKDYDITLEDLYNQWHSQDGKCPYSGINLVLSTNTKIIRDPIISASLDRIDSSKGYLKGNIQFVSRSLNFMKGQLSHNDTLRLCKIIADFHKS